jgi:tRNA A-37 threonylcarbamoyl transferase component Bud32
VPSVISREDSELLLSIIKGQTLFNIFEKSIDYDIVVKLFDDLNYRHQLAFKYNEPRLCHIDANLRNIMYSDNKIFHIDFEMGRESEPTNMWAQREITKLLISLSQVTDSMQNVLSLFFEIYTHVEIIEQFIDSKFGSKSRELIEKKLNKNGYTLINLAVEMNNYLVNSRNG